MSTVGITLIRRSGEEMRLSCDVGNTLLDVARANDIDDIEGICDGSCLCSTCHVHVADNWVDRLPEADEDEEDVLDNAKHVQDNSRLGCQITLTPDLDGLVVTVAPHRMSP